MKKIIFLAVTLLASLSSLSQLFFENGGLIVDNQQNNDYPIMVSGLSQSMLNSNLGVVQVCVNISHPLDSDFNVSLVSPDGTFINVFSGIVGSDNDFTDTCFNQSALNSINTGIAPFTSVFKPQETLGNLNNNQDGNGVWKLRILDSFLQDEGTLINWSITFGSNASTPALFSSSNLPIVLITTSNAIVNEPPVIGFMKIIDNGTGVTNNVTDTPNNYNGKIKIELRGNYSQSLPQKPYKVTTINTNESDLNVSLLGMPLEHDWNLIANYNDKVFMRNQLAYKLFNEMGHYATRNKYCEVVVNGSYQGVFY